MAGPVDLAVAPGETLALLGESGSGKTTVLTAIAGFVTPLAGEIWLSGQLASAPGRHLPPERRRIGMVFQDHALWPHMSVLDTVAYPLRRAGAARAAARRRRGRHPGPDEPGPAGLPPPGSAVRRRAAAGRAGPGPGLRPGPVPVRRAHRPPGRRLRAQILEEVARRRAADGAAAIYATHDAAEALAIAGRVAVLHSGRLAQAGLLTSTPNPLT